MSDKLFSKDAKAEQASVVPNTFTGVAGAEAEIVKLLSAEVLQLETDFTLMLEVMNPGAKLTLMDVVP